MSAYIGDYDDGNGQQKTITGFDVDLDYVRGPFELLAEYAYFDPDDGVNAKLEAMPDELYGYYVQANYHFWPAALNDTFLTRGFANPTMTFAMRYGMAHIGDDGDDGSTNDPDNEEHRWTLGINYRPVEAWVFKLEYLFNDTDNEELEFGDADGLTFSAGFSF